MDVSYTNNNLFHQFEQDKMELAQEPKREIDPHALSSNFS
jgi:hypothetical protein